MKKTLMIVCVVCTVVNVICAIAVGTHLGNGKAELQAKIDRLSNTNSTLDKQLTESREECSTLSSRVTDLESENETLKKKADFMDNYIKVVEDDGQKTYHTYGCSYFDGSSFWAYNSEQVVGESGYTRCPYCN